MKQTIPIQQNTYKIVTAGGGLSIPLSEKLLNDLGAEGWGIAGVIQPIGDVAGLILMARASGVFQHEIEVPEDARVAGVSLVPGNGRQLPPKGFQR